MRHTIDLAGRHSNDLQSSSLLALPLVAASPPKPIEQAEVEKQLREVFVWDKAGAYAFYLLDLPGRDLAIVDNNVAEVDGLAKQEKVWQPYDAKSAKARIVLSVPPLMVTLPPRYRICVSLDSLGVVVPASAAHIVSASFIPGLVARLMLAKFGDRSSENFLTELDLLAPQKEQLVTGYGNSADSFEKQFTLISAAKPLQASGFFLGWNAGGDLKGASPAVVSAIWNLLRSRFTWDELGELTAYGLSYALGFMRVQVVLEAANTPAGGGVLASPQDVLNKLRDDPRIGELGRAVGALFKSLADAFLEAKIGQSVGKAQLESFRDFLVGYQLGGLHAAEDVFVDVLRVGYGIGYSDGFRVGYTKGYADGYKAGYKKGKKTNWGQVLSDVATIAKTVGTIVSIFG